MTNSKYQRSLVLWSIVWASALVTASFLFRGKPAKYWVEPAILVAAITHLMWKWERRTRCGQQDSKWLRKS
jgi:hypothetical protein